MQSGVSVGDDAITGTLNYLSEGPVVEALGAGNFMALKFSNIDEAATSVLVSMDPNSGEEPIELVGSETMNGVFEVTSTSQVLKVVSTDGTRNLTQTFALTGLTLVEQ